MFGLQLEFNVKWSPETQPPILALPHLRLATARSAFTLLARTLRPTKVWLPSYLCGVVLDAFVASRSRVTFYAVGKDLTVIDDTWIDEVESGDMVIFIDYFGFALWDRCGKQVKNRGAWVVEDACQAMLNASFSGHSDYVIASPRKFLGVPDGGILLAQNGTGFPQEELLPPPTEWWLNSLEASQLRAEFDRHGGDRKWFDLYRMTDPHGPIEPWAMSELSSLLLDHCVDYEVSAASRRRNFSLLAAALPEFAVFRELSKSTVPLGFPVRVHERERVRQGLFDLEIYPPVHWPIKGVVPKEFQSSHQLAQEILMLPCDQRYSSEDMGRLATEFKKLRPVPPI